MSEQQMRDLITRILSSVSAVRYVALLQDTILISEQRGGIAAASRADSDRYEELFVNPTLLTAATQRGNVDCGGLRYLLVAYGNFFQFVQHCGAGHISVCIDREDNVIQTVDALRRILQDQ